MPALRRLLLAAAIVAALLPRTATASGGGAIYRVDATHSSVEFSITKWRVTRQTGIFRELDGTIRMADGRPESARVDIRVAAASIDTRNDGRDEVVRSEDFLDVERHPELMFRSRGIRRTGAASFAVTGDLTIRGVTRRITAPVTVLAIGEVPGMGEIASFETRFAVDRREFGVLGSRWSGGRAILGDEVRVALRIVARKGE